MLGRIGWPPGGKYPIHYTSRSFDGRKTWQEWKPGLGHGRGPITEGSAVQLRDGRILLFDVHAEHTGGKRFEASFWISKDGFRTLQGRVHLPFFVPNIGPQTDRRALRALTGTRDMRAPMCGWG